MSVESSLQLEMKESIAADRTMTASKMCY